MLALVLAVLLSPAHLYAVEDPDCARRTLGLISEAEALPFFRPEVNQDIGRNAYTVSDPNTDMPDIGLSATLDRSSDGKKTRLFFRVATKDKRGKWVTSLRAHEEYRRALQHFKGTFDGIEDHWSAPGSMSTNMDQFNEALRNNPGLSPEGAALLTWTGRQATGIGCTHVTIKKLEGPRGHHTHAELFFDFPDPPPKKARHVIPYELNTDSGSMRNTYDAHDSNALAFQATKPFATAELLISQRTLVISIADTMADGTPSQSIRAAEQFANIMAYFKGRFDRIEVEVRDNDPYHLKLLNQLTAGGGSIEDALKKTSAGLRAIEAGYTQVKLDTKLGVPGHYGFVSAVFEKP